MLRLSYLPPLAIGLGLLLLVMSLLWPYWSNPKAYWSEPRAGKRTDAGLQWKVLSHQLHEARTDAERQRIEALLKDAQTQYGQSEAELEDARRRYNRPIRLLWWSGLACLLFGVVAHYVRRGMDG